MPPKAQAAQQEEKVQLKTLMINLSLALSDQALEQFQTTLDALAAPHSEYIEFVTKSKLRLRAVEAGFLNDPELLNEKQRKDPKFMQQIATCPTEMNAELNFKCFQSLVQEIIALKSDPKLQQQKQTQKKDTKKDAKKDSKVEEEVTEKRLIDNFDMVFITVNLPENKEELDYFFENNTLMSQLILYTKQKTITKESPDFIDTLQKTKQILEDDLNIDLQEDFAILKHESQEDSSRFSKFQQISQVIDEIKSFRSKQDQMSEFRNLLILENNLDLEEDETDEDRVNHQARQHWEAVVNYTEKIKEFQEFKSSVRTKKVKEHEIEVDPTVVQYHKKQLQNVKESSFGIGLYLESLLDEVAESNPENKGSRAEQSQHEEKLNQLFKKFDDQILQQIYKEKDDYVNIYNYNDKIIQQVQDQKFHNGDSINQRVKSLYDNVRLPGINRHLMPAPVSENLRKAKHQMVLQLISQDFEHFSHNRDLSIFEKMLTQFQPKRSWDLQNSVYTENLNEEELRQSLNASFLLDSHTLTHYDEDYDKLYLSILYKNPPGRILRKQWKYQDKILPNLQYYYKMKSVNHDDLYYDEDCLKLGNISEKVKYLYPMDQALIYQKKQTFGEHVVNHCGVVQESYHMGISKIENPYIWMNLNHSNQRLTIEGTEEMTSSLTLKSGLFLKFLPNGDIVQTMQKSPQVLKRNFSDIVSPYDEHSNYSSLEINRVMTKHGNIIKTMKDGKKVIYLTNGNIIVKQNKLLTTTNNQGKRFKKRLVSDTIEPAETIEVKHLFDITTQSQVCVRGDRTVIIKYSDKSQMIIFPDETKIYQKEDTWVITHPTLADVKIRVDKTKQRLGTIIGAGSAFASVGKDDIMMRTFDGRVVETFLDNGTKIVGYLEKKETEVYQQYVETYVNLYHFPDNTVVKVQQNDIAIIGGNDREKFQDPAEYFLQLFCLPNERKQGVYTADLSKQVLWTKDQEGNLFELKDNGTVESLIAVSFDMNKKDIHSPEYSEDEYFDVVNEYLPLSLETIDPELYVINNDNTATKIYSEGQVENYFRLKKQEPNTQIMVNEAANGLKNYQLLTKIQQKHNNMIEKANPKIIDTINRTYLDRQNPESKEFVYRHLVKYGQFDKQAREKIQQDLASINKYRQSVDGKRNQNVIQSISHDLKDQEDRIQMRLYQQSQQEEVEIQ